MSILKKVFNKIVNNKVQVTNNIGRTLWVWNTDSFYTERLSAGPYQKQNLIFARKLCPNPNTILDIGMNIGMNTIEYSTWAKRVIGFEPVTSTYNLALDNIADNKQKTILDKGWFKLDDGSFASLNMTGKIETHNIALGPTNSSIEMHIKKNDGHNRVANDNGEWTSPTGKPIKRNEGYKRAPAIQKTLDSFNYKNVDYIKIDVEGYELCVLQGAKKTIERCRPIIQVECVAIQPTAFGQNIQQLIDFLLDKKYVFCTCDGVIQPREFQHVKKKMDRFFIPKEMIQKKYFKSLLTNN